MKNLKYLICFILGGIVFSSIGVIADTVINASGIMYNDKTVGSALDDLYSKIEEINSTGDASASDILIGKSALVKGTKITGTIQDRGTIQDTGGLGCFPSGCDSGDSQYYSFNNIPEGYYHKDGYSWAPEIRVNAKTFRNALGVSENKIASGESIAGVTGTYTSDATVSASNILSGKTAYVNGTKVTGTMRDTTIRESDEAGLNSTYPTIPVIYGYYPQLNTATDGTKIFSISAAEGYYFTTKSYVSITQSTLASVIDLSADKIACGQVILDITGTYGC